MADRIITMRTKLHESLKAVGAPGGWDHIVNQIGALFRIILWLGSSCSGSPDRQRPVASFHVVSAPRHIGVAFLAADMCLPGMRNNVQWLREGFVARLAEGRAMRRCAGMFSFTGLTAPQVEVLTQKYHIYLTKVSNLTPSRHAQARDQKFRPGVHALCNTAGYNTANAAGRHDGAMPSYAGRPHLHGGAERRRLRVPGKGHQRRRAQCLSAHRNFRGHLRGSVALCDAAEPSTARQTCRRHCLGMAAFVDWSSKATGPTVLFRGARFLDYSTLVFRVLQEVCAGPPGSMRISIRVLCHV